jgi:hypothetical protein
MRVIQKSSQIFFLDFFTRLDRAHRILKNLFIKVAFFI